MSLTLADLEDILAGMMAAGLTQLSYRDGRDSIVMRLDPGLAASAGTGPLPPVTEPETISTVSMGRLAFSHPARPCDAAAEGLSVVAGQAVAYVISGHAITAVVAQKPGRLGRRLLEEGAVVGYGTPVFEVNPLG